MDKLATIVQAAIALSVAYVWIFRFDNVVKEFKQFGLSDLTRNMVGAAKNTLATLLVVGIWFPSFILASASLMGVFMLSAQYFHFKAGNPIIKKIPSLILLLLCAFLVASSLQ
jgi:hypothetical protein